jgi:hypothetical protein
VQLHERVICTPRGGTKQITLSEAEERTKREQVMVVEPAVAGARQPTNGVRRIIEMIGAHSCVGRTTKSLISRRLVSMFYENPRSLHRQRRSTLRHFASREGTRFDPLLSAMNVGLVISRLLADPSAAVVTL